MGNLIFLLTVWGVGAAVELPKLWKAKRIKEICLYLLISGLGLTIFGLYIFKKDMASIYSFMSGKPKI